MLERPYLGRGCCVVSAADLVADELRSWRRWVRAVEVDRERCRFVVVVSDDAPLTSMLGALADLDYPARIVHDERLAEEAGDDG